MRQLLIATLLLLIFSADLRGAEKATPPELTKAYEAFVAEDFSEAARLLEELIATHPELADAHRLLGHSYHRLQRPDDARREFRRALGLGSFEPDLLLRLIDIELTAGATPTVLNALRLAALVEPTNREVALLLADQTAESGGREEALSLYRRILAEDPERVDVWTRVAVLEQKRGEITASIVAHRVANELSEPSASRAEKIGDLLWRAGDPVEAGKWYDRALLLEPEAGDGGYKLQLRRAQALYTARDGASAREVASRLVEDRSAGPGVVADARLLLGTIAFESGDEVTAVKEWTHLDASERLNSTVARFIGVHTYRAGQHERAVHWLQQAAELAPRPDRDVTYFRVRALLELEDKVAARQVLRKYLEHFGRDDRAIALIARLAS